MKETEIAHMKAKHRAEITGARVKIDQLTGAAGTLRDTAGSAAEEVKLLLNQVTELRDANKALQQQHALEVSKVLAVKQEMLSLDEQHRRYVKDAEERFTQAELDTEKHFTADREQLLKSHQRLVDADFHSCEQVALEDHNGLPNILEAPECDSVGSYSQILDGESNRYRTTVTAVCTPPQL